MIRVQWFAALLLGVVASGFASGATAEKPALTACTLPDLDEPARCGSLEVAENPDRPEGRRISIAFAVIPATGAALPDAIVPLHGGPGENVIGEAGSIARQFAVLRETRDILLIDQRGTGRSNALKCTLLDEAAPAANLLHFVPPDAVSACAQDLGPRADLTQYTQLHFANDLEAVRKALGYAQFNLYAGSYGTRAAQVFMRAYPQSVRTVTLNGGVPLDYITPLTMAQASQAMFEATFDACAADAACAAAYPELRPEFERMLARLDAGEVRVAVPGAERAPLARGRVVEWLRARLYRPRTAAEVPSLIHRAHGGDWSPVVAGILAHARNIDREFAVGLWLTVTCSEDVAFLSEADIGPASAGTWLGEYRVRQQQEACRRWPQAKMPAGYRVPTRTAIPTMFVSGDMDAVTPLDFTANMAPGFSNRVEVVLRGRGHTEWDDCVGALHRQLVESGRVDGIEPNCPAQPRPPFAIAAPDQDPSRVSARRPDD